MKKRKKITLWSLGTVLVLLLAGTIGGSLYLVGFALNPEKKDISDPKVYQNIFRHFPDAQVWTDSLRSEGILRDTTLVVDGLKRHALYAKAENAEGRTAVIVHGYKDCCYTFLYLGRIYRENLGYNILLPDLYAHGESDGDAIRMGWMDRFDIIDWCREAEGIFGGGPSRIVVHGVSMGAATTMCVSGEADLPESIRCFVEDCGYTSVWDQFSSVLKNSFGLPEFPLLYTAGLITRLRDGWGFKEASPLKSVARCERPMLFIHGDADDFVPYAMLEPLYEAKTKGEKDILIVPGAAHARACQTDPEAYTAKVVAFAGRYID